MTQPDEIPFSYTTSEYNGYNISCNGGSNGFINAIAEGDFPPFSYSWSGPNGFSSNEAFIENLNAGTYTLTIVDDNGCEVTDEILLNEPDEIIIILSHLLLNSMVLVFLVQVHLMAGLIFLLLVQQVSILIHGLDLTDFKVTTLAYQIYLLEIII